MEIIGSVTQSAHDKAYANI